MDDGGLAFGKQAVCLGGQSDTRLIEGGGKGGAFMPLQGQAKRERRSVHEQLQASPSDPLHRF